jgi:hypothetical protein
MQVNPDLIKRFFHYHRPTEPMKGGRPFDDLKASLELRPTLAIVDGVTEAMTLQGLNPNDNKDIATFGYILPRPMKEYGAATVCCDHVVKDKEGRGRYALGGVHKLNGIDGASFILQNRYPIGDDLKGVSYIRIAKDRPGQLRKHAVPGKPMFWFADLVVDLTLDGLADGVVTVAPAVDHITDHRPTVVMTRISTKLAQYPEGMTMRMILGEIKGNTDTKKLAMDHLKTEGYVTPTSPYKLIKPFLLVGDSDDDDD